MCVMRHIFAGICILLLTSQAFAQKIPLQNLDEPDLKKIVGEFSTNFLHTSVSGASTLGHVFGFEVGLVAGATRTPSLEKLAHEVKPDVKADQMPHAALLGVLSIPLGFTAEVNLIPKVGSEDFKFNTLGLAGKWTPTETLLDLPFDVAAKFSVTKSKVEFKQEISSVPVAYTYDNTMSALTFFISKNFVILEPYFGAGVVNAKGDLGFSATSPTTVFSGSTTTQASASAKRSGSVWMIGTEVKLLILKLGVEYTNMMNTSRVSGKLSLYF